MVEIYSTRFQTLLIVQLENYYAHRLDIERVQNHIHEKAGLLCVTPLNGLLVSNWLDNFRVRLISALRIAA